MFLRAAVVDIFPIHLMRSGTFLYFPRIFLFLFFQLVRRWENRKMAIQCASRPLFLYEHGPLSSFGFVFHSFSCS